MPRRKLRDCVKCRVRHGPPIGNRCKRQKEELDEFNAELEANVAEGERADAENGPKSGEDCGVSTKHQLPPAPTYQPLGEEKHVPLFQSAVYGGADQASGVNFATKSQFVNLQAQSGWEARPRPFTLHPRSGYVQPAAASGLGPQQQDQSSDPAMVAMGAVGLDATAEDSMSCRMRKQELLVERMADVQRSRVLADYHKAHASKEKTEEPGPSTESSDDSESECGEWTEGDGRDLWRATKERKKRNPFDHSYTRKGEAVESFELLMVVTFKTMEELLAMGKNVKGLVWHGLAMSEKAATGIYKVDAFVKYDESVRDRAGRFGPSTFGVVNQEDVMRHFCYDNAEASKTSKGSSKASTSSTKRKTDKICLKYNGENGCNFKSCTFAHKCIACEELGHSRKDCKSLKKKEAK